MKYQKIINFLENTPNQPTKFRTKKWFEINDESRGTYNTNSQIRFKTSMFMSKSSLCDYSHAHILVSGTIKVTKVAAVGENNSILTIFKIKGRKLIKYNNEISKNNKLVRKYTKSNN